MVDLASDNQPAPTSSLRRLVRSLRNLTALALLTLSVGVLVLWVRSVWQLDMLLFYNFDKPASVTSADSTIKLTSGVRMSKVALSAYSHPDVFGGRWAARYMSAKIVGGRGKGFHFKRSGTAWWGSAPHWFVALVLATLAFALKPKPRLKFSLADLLVLMTFSAVLIAGVAGLSRLAS